MFIFDNLKLIPEAWKTANNSFYYVFNPAIVRLENGYAMCYRVVDSNDGVRKLATCHLTHDFKIVEGSVTPLSDLIRFSTKENYSQYTKTWHADPRYFFLQGKHYISWNDNKPKPNNHQFLLEMDSTCLVPAGNTREIIIGGPRRVCEKNWMFFDHNNKIFCIYSVNPHRILGVDLDDPEFVKCEEVYSTSWENQYSEIFNDIHNSVPPVRIGEKYLSLAHSRYVTSEGSHSVCCGYEFEAKPPFRVLGYMAYPFDLPGSESKYSQPRLHKELVQGVYANGFLKIDENLVISYGILNEFSAVASVPLSEFYRSFKSVDQPARITGNEEDILNIENPISLAVDNTQENQIPLFWWDARGWKFGGENSTRKFQTGNFGDTLAHELMELLSGQRMRQPVENEVKMIGLGSLIHRAGEGDVIWGTGIKGNAMYLDEHVKTLKVFAVRGPHTLDFLKKNNIDTSAVSHFFDPGCLIPYLYKDFIKNINPENNIEYGDIRIIPHFRDDFIIRRKYTKYWKSIISADTTFREIIRKIIGAKAVISSSLHGIVFSESLGIPAYWLKSEGGEDGYKFYDYYYGTGRFNVKCFSSIEDILKAEPMQLPVFDQEACLKTFPPPEILESLFRRK